MSIPEEIVAGIANELGSMFRLGSKKYYDHHYIEQKKKREQANWDKPKVKVRKIEPYAVELRSYRIRAGLTQQDLAGSMKTKQSAIARFEGGWTKPSTSFLERYAEEVGVELILIVRPNPDSNELRNNRD